MKNVQILITVASLPFENQEHIFIVLVLPAKSVFTHWKTSCTQHT